MSSEKKGYRGDQALTGTFGFLAFSAGAFLSGGTLRLFEALLPGIAEDFNTVPATAAVVITAFTVAYGLFQIVQGPLGDYIGRVKIASLGCFTASAATLGSAFAPTLMILALLRLAAGIGVSAVIPMALAWIGDKSSYSRRQEILGRFLGYLLLGQILGPAAGGILSEIFSWREVLVGLAAAFFLVGLALEAQNRREKYLRPVHKSNFLKRYYELFSINWVRTVLGTTFLEGVFFFGTLSFVASFLQSRFDISYGLSGTLLAFYGIGGFLYSLTVKKLLKLLSRKRFMQISGFALLTCFAVLAWIPSWQLTIPVLTVMGYVLYMLHNTLQTIATEMAPEARGMSMSAFSFSMFTGQAVGVTISGLVIKAAGYSVIFTAAGFLLLIIALRFASAQEMHYTHNK